MPKKSKYSHLSREQLEDKLEKLERERYGLVWEDKDEDVAEQCETSLPVLKEDISREIVSDITKPYNFILEGDNYHSLYTLIFTHKKKIDVIYIDPPYNTGKKNEWKYNDHWVDVNDSYRHSKWLSFINKRLRLAKNLLKDTGVIFISIDDNEVVQLKMLCDKIFGEQNFLANIVWQRTYAPISMKKYFSECHEYLLIYSKNKDYFILNLLPRTDKQNKDYKNPDDDPRGLWKGGNLTVGPIVEKQVYEIIGPTGKSFYPPKGYCWRFTKERFKELIQDNRIWFGKNGNNSPLPKLFLSEVQDGITPMTL